MIIVLVVLLTLGALGVATITWFRQRFLRDTMRDAMRRLYLTQARLNELESTVQMQARREMAQRQSGGIVLDPSMKIAEAIALDPRMRDVLAQFHLGGCSSCAINEEDTIEQAAMSHGIDLGRLMAALTALSHGKEPTLQETRPGNLLQLTEL
jgi:hybrid cluster-associated redox disulfide protein